MDHLLLRDKSKTTLSLFTYAPCPSISSEHTSPGQTASRIRARDGWIQATVHIPEVGQPIQRISRLIGRGMSISN